MLPPQTSKMRSGAPKAIFHPEEGVSISKDLDVARKASVASCHESRHPIRAMLKEREIELAHCLSVCEQRFCLYLLVHISDSISGPSNYPTVGIATRYNPL